MRIRWQTIMYSCIRIVNGDRNKLPGKERPVNGGQFYVRRELAESFTGTVFLQIYIYIVFLSSILYKLNFSSVEIMGSAKMYKRI